MNKWLVCDDNKTNACNLAKKSMCRDLKVCQTK